MLKRLAVGALAVVSIAAIGVMSVQADPLPVSSVVASTEDPPNPASNAIDGNLTTRWSGFGDGATLTLELTECTTVEIVQIDWFKGEVRVASFDIETSEDGTTWVPVFSGNSSGVDMGFEDVDVTDQLACFVRLIGHGNNENDWNSIGEMIIHGTSATSTETVAIPLPLLQELCKDVPPVVQ